MYQRKMAFKTEEKMEEWGLIQKVVKAREYQAGLQIALNKEIIQKQPNASRWYEGRG